MNVEYEMRKVSAGLRPSRLRTDSIVGHAIGITFASMHKVIRGVT